MDQELNDATLMHQLQLAIVFNVPRRSLQPTFPSLPSPRCYCENELTLIALLQQLPFESQLLSSPRYAGVLS